MQFPKLETYLLDLQYLHWAQNAVYCLGHLWSLCSSTLKGLISRITTLTQTKFSTDEIPPSSSSLKKEPAAPKTFKKEKGVEIKKKDKPEDLALDLDALFGSEKIHEEPILSSNTVTEEPSATQKNSPVIKEKKPNEDASEQKNITSEQLSSGEPLLEVKEQLQSATSQETETKKPIKFTKFRRYPKKKINNPAQNSKPQTVTQPAKAASPIAQKELDKAKEPVQQVAEPIYFDNEGKGNCQLLSILKGIEMQHPDLLEYEENSKNVTLTAQKLRQIGVEFAREQIDTCGQYAADVLGYLDADRKEHNRCEVESVEREMNRDRAKIDKDFKEGKIKPALYAKRKEALRKKYSKILDHLENNVVIKTDEEFLKHLEKDGFYCSTLHLFAISIKLKLPIYVKEQNGIKGHETQKFNATESTKAPINLYRVANRHYQYVLYPETVKT